MLRRWLVPLSVLLVDDDEFFRDLASRLLTAWGLEVIGEAGTVEEALDLALELQPDTVVADIALPDGDGFDLTRRLLALVWPVQVVLISSDSDPANRLAAVRAGARGFLPKGELSDAGLRELLEGC